MTIFLLINTSEFNDTYYLNTFALSLTRIRILVSDRKMSYGSGSSSLKNVSLWVADNNKKICTCGPETFCACALLIYSHVLILTGFATSFLLPRLDLIVTIRKQRIE